ncbi:synaptophysin-like [Daphnia carinata]|uniref:synaptophysin-like n=1 Tax=Daphnia carinata TaxID=120202 RepID=UPI00257CC075|nr:synaptophysin-like [Daphnia carinata]
MDQIDINVVKEPRGFLRVLQFVFAICAFATTTNFGSTFSFIVKCKNETLGTHKITQSIEYPFRFDHVIVEEKACGNSYAFSYFGDYSSDAEFFVAAGVLAMLYSLVSLAFYCLCGSSYQTNKTIPLVDFFVTMVMAVFWLSGSAAWASGVSAVKYVSDPSAWIKNLKICMENAECSSLYAGNFAGLNISIIFGFLNFFLWTVNLWFLYKETSWFQQDNAAATGSGGQTPI